LSKPVMSLSNEVAEKFRAYRSRSCFDRAPLSIAEGLSTNGLTAENSDFRKLFLTKSLQGAHGTPYGGRSYLANKFFPE